MRGAAITATRSQATPSAGIRERLPMHLRLLIVALAFSAFLTETKFLPLKHNVGAFEVVAVILTFATFIYFIGQGLPIRFHRVMLPLFLIVIAAGLSNYHIIWEAEARVSFRILSMVILVVSLFLVVVWYNLFLVSEQNLDLFLRAVVISAAVIGLWVLFDQVRTGGSIGAAGPFRNRAHAGIYMHAAFWLVLLRTNWPKTKFVERWMTYPVVAIVLYVIAASGRRSIYIALGMGLVGLTLGALTGGWRTKRRIGSLVMFTLIAVGVFYFKASEFWKPAAFFKDRVGMVSQRVETFSGMSGETPDESFVLGQREGGLRAFRENPILGIGWGGFPKSEYSPTGHEMHSTPQRFLAELGIVGVILYLWFMLEIVAVALRTWWANRHGPFEAASLILLVAISALSVSFIYNRQMTDRTFWLMLVFGMALETWTLRRMQVPRLRYVRLPVS